MDRVNTRNFPLFYYNYTNTTSEIFSFSIRSEFTVNLFTFFTTVIYINMTCYFIS
ncbi:hypothetical protein VP495E541_P0104 [Vibrio phage 495E54-1]|nr:hypothetical protein VP495E541_P0104 [Vibrio phage 495E54-1]